MTQPPESSLGQESDYAGDPCAPEYVCVRYFVLPYDAQHPLEAAEVDAVQFLLLTCIGCPCFTAVEKGSEYVCLVNTEFCIRRQLTILLSPLAE